MALILLYHRVMRLWCDPFGLAVRPSRFDEQMAVVARRSTVMSLPELHMALDKGEAPDDAVAITFDDGYIDNMRLATPILRKHRCPATIFVATGTLGVRREFWWDEIERLILHPVRLPEVIEIEIAGDRRSWTIETGRTRGPLCRWRTRGWRAWHENDPTSRQRVYRELWALLHPLDVETRNAALRDLATRLGAGEDGRATHRIVNEEELRILDRDQLIEIGGHTVNHPSLAHLSAEAQLDEARSSRERLVRLLDRDIQSFAYPYGTQDDFDDVTIGAVREAGYLRACSNYGGHAMPGDDAFDLKRVIVQDWDGATFEAKLDEWIDRAALDTP